MRAILPGEAPVICATLRMRARGRVGPMTRRAAGKTALAAARAAADVPWPATGELHRGCPDELAQTLKAQADQAARVAAVLGLKRN